MSDVDLDQALADTLIRVEKHCVSTTEWEYPMFGGRLEIPLASPGSGDEFLLDVHRSYINLAKSTYQNRVRRVVVLVRLDIAGSPHRNPDGTDIPCPHLHVYQEGFGDKWASPLPSEFSEPSDPIQSLHEFMKYCNITKPPRFKTGLFA